MCVYICFKSHHWSVLLRLCPQQTSRLHSHRHSKIRCHCHLPTSLSDPGIGPLSSLTFMWRTVGDRRDLRPMWRIVRTLPLNAHWWSGNKHHESHRTGYWGVFGLDIDMGDRLKSTSHERRCYSMVLSTSHSSFDSSWLAACSCIKSIWLAPRYAVLLTKGLHIRNPPVSCF